MNLSQSELRTWLTCPRSHFFRYRMDGCGYAVPEAQRPAFLDYGTAFHEALAILHQAPVDSWNETIKNALAVAERFQESDLSLYHILRGQILGYRDHYGQLNEDWRLSVSERSFRVKLPHLGHHTYRYGQVWLVGRLDGIAVDAHGVEWLMEHKTASEIGVSWLPRLENDLQASFYAFVCSLGQDDLPKIAGTLYNLIRKPSIRPRQKESLKDYEARLREDMRTRPEFYFQREWTSRGFERHQEFHRALWAWVSEIQLARNVPQALESWSIPQERALRPNWNACPSCDFQDACAVRERERQEFVRAFFQKKDSSF